MKRFLIPVTLLFILLIACCGNSDNILAPEVNTGIDMTFSSNCETNLWSEVAFLAAPKKDKDEDNSNAEKEYYAEKVIGPKGGKLQIEDKATKDETKLKFPKGALDEKKLISMTITIDKASHMDFEFGPSGIYFNKPVELELSWQSLPKDVRGEDLILYYYNDGEWQEIRGECNNIKKKVTFYINHFSRYLYKRM